MKDGNFSRMEKLSWPYVWLCYYSGGKRFFTAEIKKSMEIKSIRIRNFFMKLSSPWGILLTFFLCLLFFVVVLCSTWNETLSI